MIRTCHDLIRNKLQSALMALLCYKNTLPCELTVFRLRKKNNVACEPPLPERLRSLKCMFMQAFACQRSSRGFGISTEEKQALPCSVMQVRLVPVALRRCHTMRHDKVRSISRRSMWRSLFLTEVQILKQPLTRSVLRECRTL